MIAYRVTTHGLRPPVQGGEPVPHVAGELLPHVKVDTSLEECARGWSACRTPHVALRIAGLWPDGRPSRLWRVESVDSADPIERGDKLRAATWRVLGEEVVSDAILADLHRPMADGLSIEDLVAEVQAWRRALSRPTRDPEVVEAELRSTMDRRGLASWRVRQHPTPRAAWAAWAAWDARAARDAKDAWAAWAAWDAWDARAAWDARDAWDAWAAWAARDAWDASDAWAAWAAWDAWAARDALITLVTARRGWWRTPSDADMLTVGIRDAYAAGLGIAIPTGLDELGWAMDADSAATAPADGPR